MKIVKKYKKWLILFIIGWLNLYAIFWITKHYGYQGFLFTLVPTVLLLIGIYTLRNKSN